MKTSITASYRPNADEIVQISITAHTSAYPDLLAEVKATAVAGVREILADVLAHKDELSNDA